MRRLPRIAVWHAQAEAYGRALRERLPDVPVEVITAADHDSGDANLGDADSREALRSAEVLLAWKVPPGALEAMPSLRWVQVSGAGVDHFLEREDLPASALLTRSLGRFGTQVAEYVVGFLLHRLLEIDAYREQQSRSVWHRAERPLLTDLTVGVIGLGSLGLSTARALAALGADVVGVRHSEGAVKGIQRVFSSRDWRRALPLCGALVIAAPRTAETVGMIDADALAALPPGAVLINVARGDIVDETALLAALESHHLGAAILDVFSVEPLPPEHPLWTQPRAWITPHIAAPSEVEVIVDEFADNYHRFVRQRRLANLVDRSRGY